MLVVKCWSLAVICTSFFVKPTHTLERIVGGTKVTVEEFPYQLSLRYNTYHICGATILNRKYALTAAHCVQKKGSYSVRAGSSYVFYGGVVVFIKRALAHPSYQSESYDYDIGILQFHTSLRFSGKIRPVALPTLQGLPGTGTKGIVSGWGTLFYEDSFVQKQLRAVEVPLIAYSTCRIAYSEFADITPRMFCAGYRDGGRDACQGDSGGPFVIRGVLYGLVSWGINCADPKFPGVYTNVVNLRSYIKENTGL